MTDKVNVLQFQTLYFILFWPKFCFLCSSFVTYLVEWQGVVGCGKGDRYLTSPGRPTDIGFQLGKACYPFSWQG